MPDLACKLLTSILIINVAYIYICIYAQTYKHKLLNLFVLSVYIWYKAEFFIKDSTLSQREWITSSKCLCKGKKWRNKDLTYNTIWRIMFSHHNIFHHHCTLPRGVVLSNKVKQKHIQTGKETSQCLQTAMSSLSP